MADWTAGRRRL